ncbi:MAG: hypothetical protein IKW49_05805 [Opitutales bacterium]|nr:hypothetical protein [Opitutales bacterium]
MATKPKSVSMSFREMFLFSLANGMLHYEAPFLNSMEENQNKIVFFREKSIRRVWQDESGIFPLLISSAR